MSAASQVVTGTVHLTGDVTIVTAAERKDELLAALAAADPAIGLELDLADVDELDTSGVQLLLALRSEAIARDLTLRLVNVGGRAEVVLRTIGLHPDLTPIHAAGTGHEERDDVR